MASKTKHPYTIIRGGRLLDIAKRSAVPADILIGAVADRVGIRLRGLR